MCDIPLMTVPRPPHREALPPGDLHFELLENGLDYLLSAVEHLSDEEPPRNLKYAVLHLAAGVELIIKERLRRDDWRLLFADEKKASEQALARGSFRSVGPEEAIERLEDAAGIVLDPADESLLKSLRDRRNRLQHFAITDTSEAVTALTARVLGFQR
jgi:hypothetical protein